MKILFLSFFYEPDLSACSFRAAATMKAMRAQLPESAKIELFTTMPNRYSSFSKSALEFEEDDQLILHRIKVPAHKSGMLVQALAYLVYFKSVLKLTSKQDYDLIYVTSGRFFSSFLGALISRKKKIPLYLDIRDIFVDTLKDVLPKYVFWPLLPVLKTLEYFSLGQASKINLISKGFDRYFQKTYQHKTFDYFTNGIDREFLQAFDEQKLSENLTIPTSRKVRIVYAGNFGEGQGLHNIVPALAKQLEDQAEFKIIGDGGRRQQLEDELKRLNVTNVTLTPPVQRKDLIAEYKEADILFMHLNNCDAFLKVLPSKLFEYGATGKLVLAGVSGYSADFLKLNLPWAKVFNPCDVSQAISSFEALKVVTIDRDKIIKFRKQYSREVVSCRMAQSVLSLQSDTSTDAIK
jgi:hypothetical protein